MFLIYMQSQNSKFSQPNSIWCPSNVPRPQVVGIAIPTYLESARLEHLGQPAAYLSHIKLKTTQSSFPRKPKAKHI